MTEILLLVLAAANFALFGLYGWDKRAAIRGRRRVPEVWLIVPAAFGLFLGAWFATEIFRHKTQKTSFRLKLLGATLVNAAWVWIAWSWGMEDS